MIITFDADSRENLVPDNQVLETAARIVADKKDVTVCQALMVDAIRLQVCEGKIDGSELIFEFKGAQLPVTKIGRIAHWPSGFCNLPIDILSRLL